MLKEEAEEARKERDNEIEALRRKCESIREENIRIDKEKFWLQKENS
jgi:hypothetical protein